LTHCCEGRSGGASIVVIVEANDGDIAGNSESGFSDGRVCTDRHLVVGREYAVDWFATGK